MGIRDYITQSELNGLMANPLTQETLSNSRHARMYFPLFVGVEAATRDRIPIDYPVFREAEFENTRYVDDQGTEHRAWVLKTPLVVLSA